MNNFENSYKTHIVIPRDTLWKLSKSFGVSVDEIKEANNLNSNNIYTGQILKIPSSYNKN